MKNKILIKLSVPIIEQSYDLFIPVNETINDTLNMIEKSLYELSDLAYIVTNQTKLVDKKTGIIFENEKIVRDTILKNGSEVILI